MSKDDPSDSRNYNFWTKEAKAKQEEQERRRRTPPTNHPPEYENFTNNPELQEKFTPDEQLRLGGLYTQI